MIVTCVHVWVKEQFIQDFITETVKNHNESIKEPGNLRFDFLQDEQQPNKFLIYEAYESEDYAKAHKETNHYKVWRQAVADWMAQPRAGIRYHVIQPLDKELW
jgi:(4S)-4-hydroxy-5-phosphonooxypentane-2,3-dione isomerase